MVSELLDTSEAWKPMPILQSQACLCRPELKHWCWGSPVPAGVQAKARCGHGGGLRGPGRQGRAGVGDGAASTRYPSPSTYQRLLAD